MSVPRIPFWPRLLGFAGLLPQLGCLAALWFGDMAWHEETRAIALGYAMLILSFLGGMWWGFAASAPAAERRRALGWLWIAAVVPSLLALAIFAVWTLFLPVIETALVMTGAAIVLTLAVDARLGALSPRWWLGLRVPLSLGLGMATIACALA